MSSFFSKVSLILFLLVCSLVFTSEAQEAVFLPAGSETMDEEQVLDIFTDSIHAQEPRSTQWVAWNLYQFDWSQEHSNAKGIASAATRLAHEYIRQGLFLKAGEFAEASIQSAQMENDQKAEIWALFLVAEIEIQLGRYVSALKYAQKTLSLSKGLVAGDSESQHERKELIAWSHNMIGEVHRSKGNFISAIASYEQGMQSLDTGPKAQYRPFAILSHNIGISQIKAGNQEKGKEYLSRPSVVEIRKDAPAAHFEIIEAEIDYFHQNEKWEDALALAQQGYKEAGSLGYQTWVLTFGKLKAEIYERSGNIEDALYSLKASQQLEAQILNETVIGQISILGVQNKMAKVEAENELLLLKARSQKQWFWGLLILAFFILSFGLVLLYLVRQSRKQNQTLKAKNDQLDELIHEKEMWMNLMAHDLKTPLNSIDGMLSLVRDPSMPDDVRQGSLDRITDSVSKGTELIDNLLEISRLERNDFQIRRSRFKPWDLLHELKADLSPIAEKKRIDLQLNDDFRESVIHTDRDLVRRIMENLLSNAIKYSLPHTVIQAKIEQNDHKIRLLIKDQGPGLSREDQKLLFKKFVRLTPQPTGGENSTGLGLAIVKAISEKLEGSLEVESELGNGSTFGLSFYHGK